MSASRKALYVALLLACLVGGLWAGSLWRSNPTRLTFLSVGQGDCIVLQTDGRTVLIDAGPVNSSSSAGERMLSARLNRLGVDRVDLLLITHPDADHIGGVKGLARRFRIASVIMAECFREHPKVRELQSGPLNGSRFHWVDDSTNIDIGNLKLDVLAPTDLTPEDDNDGSLFVRISSGAAAAVLTGDAPIDVEATMIGRLATWRAQVLQAGHHGSRTSTGSAWLKAVQPEWVVVSCGRNNRYDHPHRSVLQTIEGTGAKVARTDQEGDLTFTLGDNGFERD